MVEEHKLYDMFEKIKSTIPKNEWKYYHLQSVENFIYHIKSFKTERTKEKMAHEIEKYLELVVEKMHEELEIHDKSKQLFPSIWKLSDTYKYEVGFIQKPSYLVTFILLIALFFLLKFSLTTSEALGVCILVFVAYSAFCYFKVKAKKVF